ncbi:MAG: iron ABC transporter permease [Deferrisomatales bacterium]|nr:iron ABC transporter permease [Deferrisomatales bacterium]
MTPTNTSRHNSWLPWALAMALPATILWAAGIGSSGLGWADLARALGETAGLLAPRLDEVDRAILLNVRLSRVLLAAVAGGGLAVAGVIFQGILLNPLADPYTVGVSSGAALGASVAILLGLGGYTAWGMGLLPLAAFAGALLALGAVQLLAASRGFTGSGTLILAGIVVSTTLSAGISLLKSLNEDSVSSIVFWIMGSFSGRGWWHVAFCLPYVAAGLVAALFYGRDLDLLVLGDEGARQLGVDSVRVRRRLLVGASMITGACVAVSGVIGFVGLVVPHLLRMTLGPAHRRLLFSSFLGGGILLVLADALSRTLLPGGEELPVGVVTALLGGPFFCYLLRLDPLARGRGEEPT